MSRLLNGIKSFVHSITTTDHYASYDPSGKTGEDATPLASDARRSSSSSLGQQYVPGMRTAQLGGEGNSSTRDSISLNDMAPIPSPELSWSRIDQWIEHNYPELYDQLLGGATINDLNEVEHDLDVVLPPDVRESYRIHDGQERGAMPTGVFFGVALLDLEQVSEEWNIWRRAALRVEELSRSKSGAAHRFAPQQSFPPNAVQPVYAHPGWIPLAKDMDGNNIAVDCAPGPKGRHGQVILFGRDFDTKFVVAPSWGDFLAQFAADLESGQCFIDDDIEEAVFAFKSPTGQLVSYFNVLRRRAERAEQARNPQKKAPSPQRRSMANVSLSLNNGRVTPRIVSPTSSSVSLPRKPKEAKSTNVKTEADKPEKAKKSEKEEPKKELKKETKEEPKESKESKEEPKKEEPKKEEPKKEEPKKEESKKEESKKEEPKEEKPKEEKPKEEKPKEEKPKEEKAAKKEEPKKEEKTADKSVEKAEKTEKVEKVEKTEKTDKSDKPADKSDKPEKSTENSTDKSTDKSTEKPAEKPKKSEDSAKDSAKEAELVNEEL